MVTDIDIKQLIPQRAPIMMVDALTGIGEKTAQTCFLIKNDNLFLEEDGHMAETGLIEHIAQSASAFAGYQALRHGASKPPVGFIGEVKHFLCFRRPVTGEVLHTTVTMGPEVNGITLLKGETKIGNETVANTQLKIFMEGQSATD